MSETPDELILEQRITATLTVRDGQCREYAISAVLQSDFEGDRKRLESLAFAALCGAQAAGIVRTPDYLTAFSRAKVDDALQQIAQAMSEIEPKSHAA